MDHPSDAVIAARAEADAAREACRKLNTGYPDDHRAYLLAELVSAELRALTAAVTDALERLAP